MSTARAIVDASYREFERAECLECGRRFRPITPTHHYCGEACAYAALRRREAARARSRQKDDNA